MTKQGHLVIPNPVEEAVEQAAGSPREEEQECLGKLREDRAGVRRVMRQHQSVGGVREGEKHSVFFNFPKALGSAGHFPFR